MHRRSHQTSTTELRTRSAAALAKFSAMTLTGLVLLGACASSQRGDVQPPATTSAASSTSATPPGSAEPPPGDEPGPSPSATPSDETTSEESSAEPADAGAIDPLLDTDGDGIPDIDDKCPTEPEVYNGIQDDDGCPC